MRKLHRIILLGLLVLFLLPSPSSAMWIGDSVYADWAFGVWEKASAGKAASWVNGNRPLEWVDAAEKKGWITKENPAEPCVGAIAVWADRKTTKLTIYRISIVRKIGTEDVILESYSSTTGQTIHNTIKYADLSKVNDLEFVGYIYPILKNDYVQAPDKYKDLVEKKLIQSKGYYKGYSETWGPTYALKEFDKLAPEPGVNWKGTVGAWLQNAEMTGWKVASIPQQAVPGALLIRHDAQKKLVWVGIVRKCDETNLTVDYYNREGFSSTYVTKYKELPGQYFIGYILPERK